MRFIAFLVAICFITNYSQASVIATLEGDLGQEWSFASTNPVGHHLESIEIYLDWHDEITGFGPWPLTLYIESPDGDMFDIGYDSAAWDWDIAWLDDTGTGSYYANIDVSSLGMTGTGVWELGVRNAVNGWTSYSMDVVLNDLNLPAPGALALLGLAGISTRRRRR